MWELAFSGPGKAYHMSKFSYRQPIKQVVRERVLPCAIRMLTSDRKTAPLVLEEELSQIIEFVLGGFGQGNLTKELREEYDRWCEAYRNKIGMKKPSDIKVLYLCGPEPSNDLKVLIDNGIDPNNVWAVEAKERDFSRATSELQQCNIPVKAHHGNLSEFFEVYPESFDLVYYDACGPFLGNKPNTLDPILKLLAFSRLEPIAVLITNFSETPNEMKDRLSAVLAAYFRFRHRDLPKAFWDAGLDPAICEADDMQIKRLIASDPEPFYSDFITHFLVDLARYWIPNCRALASKAVSSNYLTAPGKVKEAMSKAERVPPNVSSIEGLLQQAGDVLLSPSSYPLYSFFRQLKRINPPEPLLSQLGNLQIRSQQIGNLIGITSMLDRVIEGHWNCLSDDMLRAIRSSWFDANRRFSCDVPLPNLLINSLLGIYGHPLFPNTRKSFRLEYRAKTTTMLTDFLVLDQCRYYFDWFPTIQMVPARFRSRGFQVLARSILDRLGRSDWSSETHPFRGAAVAGHGEISGAQFYEFEPREVISI